MHRTAVPALASVLLLFVAAPALSGQEDLRSAPPGLESLAPGSRVRITTSETSRREATYLGYRSESLVVRDDGNAVEVPMRSLRSLYVRGHSMWEASWKTAVMGGAVGATWAILVDATECPTPATCRSDYWPRTAVDAAIGAAVGGAVGALVGRFIPQWHRVFP